MRLGLFVWLTSSVAIWPRLTSVQQWHCATQGNLAELTHHLVMSWSFRELGVSPRGRMAEVNSVATHGHETPFRQGVCRYRDF